MLPVDEIRLNFSPASLVALNGVLGLLMFGIALDTRLADFRRVLRMPGAMAVGIAAQFIVLPAVSFALTLLLRPAPSIALGMLLVACCPPGNISNILTHRARGNVALSVSMTAISNALAIVLMPINFAFWGGLHPTAAPLLRRIALDPLEMTGHIVVIIGAPFVLGILCAERLPRLAARLVKPARRLRPGLPDRLHRRRDRRQLALLPRLRGAGAARRGAAGRARLRHRLGLRARHRPRPTTTGARSRSRSASATPGSGWC